MKHHKIRRIETSSDCESFIQACCSCGWHTKPISNMHNAQLTVLCNMETTHLRMQDGEQRLFIGYAIERCGELEYSDSFLFWSTERGAYDVYEFAMKTAMDRGNGFKWDRALQVYWNTDSSVIEGKGQRMVDKGDEAIVEKYYG